jgi:DNA-binding GntR family transcriptional regulator
MADILGCQVMDPFVCSHLYFHGTSGEPLEIVNYYIRADSYKFRLKISTDDLDFLAFEDK